MWSKYPNSIREKNQTPWTIQIVSVKLWLFVKIYLIDFCKNFQESLKKSKHLELSSFMLSKKHKYENIFIK